MTPLHRTDSRKAIEFLRKRTPKKQLTHLFSLQEGRPLEARSFDLSDDSEIELAIAWIEQRQGKANLYYSVNFLNPGVRDRKASKKDVSQAWGFHVDVDDVAALERIQSILPPPTLVIFSGGGYQAFWWLREPSNELDRVERINAELARRLRGDKCHNIDRMMRVPFTDNIPNAKKLAAGRKIAVAYLVEQASDWTRTYTFGDFPEIATDLQAAAARGDSWKVRPPDLGSIDDLPTTLPRWLLQLIELGDDGDAPMGSKNARFPSRSEAVWRAVREMARCGCTQDQIVGSLLNHEYGISASIIEKRKPAEYAARQAQRALEMLGSSWPDVTKSLRPLPTLRNTILALRRMDMRFAFNQFKYRKIVEGVAIQEYQGDLSDDACAVLRHCIIERYGFDPGKEQSREAAQTLSVESPFHPIRDYLGGLTWDRVPRLASWLITYMGAEPSALNQAFGRLILIAAVRRIRAPGTKFDCILVLEGPQGGGKSTAIKVLAGEENFSDQEVLTLDPKAQMEALEGVWLFEICELEGISRADTSKVKAFASRSVDQGRPAYARFKEARPRQTVFIGTTNDDKYLRDPTGNRRFWPVKVAAVDLAALRRDRDQLWAEAAYWEAKDEPIVLVEELWPQAQEEQDARVEDDPWLDKLSENIIHVDDLVGDVARVSTIDLLTSHLEIPPDRQQPFLTKRLASVMRKLGWEGPKPIRGPEGKIFRGYERQARDENGQLASWVDQTFKAKF